MPINVTWASNPDNVYTVHYWGDVTTADMTAAFITTSQMILQTQPRIDGIVVFDRVFRLPKNFVEHRSRLWQRWPPNLGKLVYTGNQFGWEIVTLYLEKFTSHNWEFLYAPTLTAAIAIIETDRAKSC